MKLTLLLLVAVATKTGRALRCYECPDYQNYPTMQCDKHHLTVLALGFCSSGRCQRKEETYGTGMSIVTLSCGTEADGCHDDILGVKTCYTSCDIDGCNADVIAVQPATTPAGHVLRCYECSGAVDLISRCSDGNVDPSSLAYCPSGRCLREEHTLYGFTTVTRSCGTKSDGCHADNLGGQTCSTSCNTDKCNGDVIAAKPAGNGCEIEVKGFLFVFLFVVAILYHILQI